MGNWEWIGPKSHRLYLTEETAKRLAIKYGGIARPMVIVRDEWWDNHCQ